MPSLECQLSLIIQPDELKAALSAEPAALLRLIDVRNAEAYSAGHINGAVHFDVANVNISRHPATGLLPTVEQFNRSMSSISLSTEHHAVVYDDRGGPPAARLAWTLKAFGHKAVSMLDGGLQAWQAEGLPLTRKDVQLTPGHYQGRLNPDAIADREYILKHLTDSNMLPLDARSPAEYRGEDRRTQRGGHIPGAVNLDWTLIKDPNRNMRFRSRQELEELLAKHGVDRNKEIICYCQSHQRSAVLCLLLESLGYSRVKGYPGAWSDWGNQADTPIEIGE